jgi:hypothetical protein
MPMLDSSGGICAQSKYSWISKPVRSGRAANEPWKFYDLGHGYCAYDFFEQCPHRMACAKCTFYMPKSSSQAQLLESIARKAGVSDVTMS